MRLHYLQHVPFEGPENIAIWAETNRHALSGTHFYAGHQPPPVGDVDWLIVMGGPMNIYEEDKYPWLAAEKKFIEQVIAAGKIVLGVCLGAQLIADILGGKVTRNPHKEIGWFPVRLTADGSASPVFAGLPPTFTPLHWHGDTFALPPNCRLTASSDGCAHQAFEFRGRVVGLQFHFETPRECIERWVKEGGEDLSTPGKYVHTAAEMLAQKDRFRELEGLLKRVLDNMGKNSGKPSIS